MKLGEFLVKALEQYQVDTVFGIPGVHTIEMYRGLAASSIQHITPRHEQGAGFMADGYARVTGKPGVCFCITGPGMTNITTAMGQAFADSIPMLVVSSVNNTHTLGLSLGHLHELKNQSELVSGVSAFSHTLQNPEEIAKVLNRAFSVFTSARPRPVHIEIPIEMLEQTADLKLPTPALPRPPEPDSAQIEQVANVLGNAESALVLIGGGCINAKEQVETFVNLLGAPTCLTVNARGLLKDDHPLLLDGVQNLPEFRNYLLECKVCIAIGTELGETDYDFYGKGPLVTKGELIRIDIDPLQLTANATPTISVASDAALALRALNRELSMVSIVGKRDQSLNVVSTLNSALRKTFSEHTHQYDQLLDTINATLPDAIIVGDSTKPIYHANFIYRAPQPRRWFNSATGFGTLGYALPAAMGAKLGKPELPVVAIAGDGGFQFTMNELMSAVQSQIAIAIVVWNNNGYREIRDFMTRNDVAPVGVDVSGPNLGILCESMGARYYRAQTINEIGQSLQTLSDSNLPLLVEYVSEIDA